MSLEPITLRLDPARLVRLLASVAILLTVAHLALLMVKTFTDSPVRVLFPLFDLDRESNIPSFFSGCLFLLNAALLVAAARTAPERSWSRAVWLIFAAAFVFLSFDELFAVHELLTKPIRDALRTSGLLFFAWVIVYIPAFLLLTFLFVPVWRRLARPVRTWIALAAATYLAGAVGVEMVSGAYYESVGKHEDLTFGLLVALEEFLEMAGMVMFTHALLVLLQKESGGIRIVFPERTRSGRHPPAG